MVNIPKSRYDEPACVEAKQKELRDYKNLEVFDVVDIDEATNDIIATEWILIEKEKQDGTKVIKARLCLMGNMKESLHKICNEVPTVNNKSLKILLSIAVSQGWEIRTLSHIYKERKTMTTKPNKSEYRGKTCQGSKSLENSEKKVSTPASQFNLYQ